MENNENQKPLIANNSNKEIMANLAVTAGWVSLITDILVIFGTLRFDTISFVLEIIAITAGVMALSLRQDKKKASTGIMMGAIGVGLRVLLMIS